MIFPSFLMSLILMSCSGPTNHPAQGNNDPEKYYPFDGKYIDLDELELIRPAGIYVETFKTQSKFAFRFNAPSDWLENFAQNAEYKNATFKIDENHILWISESGGQSKKIDEPGKDLVVDNVVGAEFLVAINGGVVRVSRYGDETGYHISKFDETGKQLFKIEIKHTDIEVKGNTYYHHPYLYYFACTPDYMVFTSNDRSYKKTVQVHLSDGKVTEFNFITSGIIRDEDEINVPGYITIDEDRASFKTLILNLSWNAKIPENAYNTAETLMKGDTLYVSFYHGISSGSSLYAFNRNTGEQLWKADVKQLDIPHSEYWNTVRLSRYENRIILEGVEEGGKYVQIFDAADGHRLFSTF
jgi:hypothetical protein